MKLTKYRPFEMSSFFDDFFTDFFDRPFGEVVNRMPVNKPAVNVSEEEGAYMIELAAPGLEKGDFELAVDQNLLTVKVEKETKTEETEGKMKRQEFNFTRFSRSFHLPETVNVDAIEATYDKGVLNIRLPKVDEAKALPVRTIEIS